MRLSQETKTETGLFNSHSLHFCNQILADAAQSRDKNRNRFIQLSFSALLHFCAHSSHWAFLALSILSIGSASFVAAGAFAVDALARFSVLPTTALLRHVGGFADVVLAS